MKFTIGLFVGVIVARIHFARITGYLFSRGDDTLTTGTPKFRRWTQGVER